ncbi:hypothetical protein BC827DRAFT_912279 [Russula dissimulans]|nr:hypothetical protein BC827DRAFT_912279 [Russula dissimulans]
MEFNSSSITISFADMGLLDVIQLSLVVLGAYRLVVLLRYVLPRDVVPHVSTAMNETQSLLDKAEAVNAIPKDNEHKKDLTMYTVFRYVGIISLTCYLFFFSRSLRAQLLRMRMESNRSPGFISQLQLLFLRGLTFRLYRLSTHIEAVRVKVELAMDELHLATGQSATTTALASSTPKADGAQSVPLL